jgi:hypothetical protein
MIKNYLPFVIFESNLCVIFSSCLEEKGRTTEEGSVEESTSAETCSLTAKNLPRYEGK